MYDRNDERNGKNELKDTNKTSTLGVTDPTTINNVQVTTSYVHPGHPGNPLVGIPFNYMGGRVRTNSYMVGGFINDFAQMDESCPDYSNIAMTPLPGTYSTGSADTPVIYPTTSHDHEMPLDTTIPTMLEMFPSLYNPTCSIPHSAGNISEGGFQGIYNTQSVGGGGRLINTQSVGTYKTQPMEADGMIGIPGISQFTGKLEGYMQGYMQGDRDLPSTRSRGYDVQHVQHYAMGHPTYGGISERRNVSLPSTNRFLKKPVEPSELPPTVILHVTRDNPEYAQKKRKARKNKKKKADDDMDDDPGDDFQSEIPLRFAPPILRKIYKLEYTHPIPPLKGTYMNPWVGDFTQIPSGDNEGMIPPPPRTESIPCSSSLLEITYIGPNMGYGVFAQMNIPESMTLIDEEALISIQVGGTLEEIKNVYRNTVLDKRAAIVHIYNSIYGATQKDLTPEMCQNLINYGGLNLDWLHETVRTPNTLSLFHTCTFINHSCDPNAILISAPGDETEEPQLQVLALRYIKKGEEVVVNYLSGLPNIAMFMSRDMRNEQLHYHNVFQTDCKCMLCSLPPAALQRNEQVRKKLRSLGNIWMEDCLDRNYEDGFTLCQIVTNLCIKYEDEYHLEMAEVYLDNYFMAHICASSGIDVCTAEDANKYFDEAMRRLDRRNIPDKKRLELTVRYLRQNYPLRRM